MKSKLVCDERIATYIKSLEQQIGVLVLHMRIYFSDSTPEPSSLRKKLRFCFSTRGLFTVAVSALLGTQVIEAQSERFRHYKVSTDRWRTEFSADFAAVHEDYLTGDYFNLAELPLGQTGIPEGLKNLPRTPQNLEGLSLNWTDPIWSLGTFRLTVDGIPGLNSSIKNVVVDSPKEGTDNGGLIFGPGYNRRNIIDTTVNLDAVLKTGLRRLIVSSGDTLNLMEGSYIEIEQFLRNHGTLSLSGEVELWSGGELRNLGGTVVLGENGMITSSSASPSNSKFISEGGTISSSSPVPLFVRLEWKDSVVAGSVKVGSSDQVVNCLFENVDFVGDFSYARGSLIISDDQFFNSGRLTFGTAEGSNYDFRFQNSLSSRYADSDVVSLAGTGEIILLGSDQNTAGLMSYGPFIHNIDNTIYLVNGGQIFVGWDTTWPDYGFINNSKIIIEREGQISVGNGFLNSDGVIQLSDESTLVINSTGSQESNRIQGGVIRVAEGANASIVSTPSRHQLFRLVDVSLEGNFTLSGRAQMTDVQFHADVLLAGIRLFVQEGRFFNAGYLTFSPSSFSSLRFDLDTVLDGGGTINTTNGELNSMSMGRFATDLGRTLTNKDNLFTGTGIIDVDVVNHGVVFSWRFGWGNSLQERSYTRCRFSSGN